MVIASLALLVAVVATVLIVEAENWGLAPSGYEHNPSLTTLTRVLIGFLACLILGGMAGWLLAGRASRRRASRNLEMLACKQLAIIRERVNDYMRRCGKWPPSLSHVGLSERMLVNPWGRPYQYVVHGDQFTIFTELPDRLYDFLALERRWLTGPGANLLTYDQSVEGWF
jgi:hypothetical protein